MSRAGPAYLPIVEPEAFVLRTVLMGLARGQGLHVIGANYGETRCPYHVRWMSGSRFYSPPTAGRDGGGRLFIQNRGASLLAAVSGLQDAAAWLGQEFGCGLAAQEASEWCVGERIASQARPEYGRAAYGFTHAQDAR